MSANQAMEGCSVKQYEMQINKELKGYPNWISVESRSRDTKLSITEHTSEDPFMIKKNQFEAGI